MTDAGTLTPRRSGGRGISRGADRTDPRVDGRGPSSDAALPSGKLPALTGIRGVAACWVVGFHIATNLGGALGNLPARDAIILRSGFLAVDLFFMLSGFVLAYSYFPRYLRDRTSALSDFAIGRAFRILPLNWAMLIALLALSTAYPSRVWSNEPLTMPSFWASMALVQAWGLSSATSWNFPAWSLSAEWAAYALFPFLLLSGKRVNGARMALAASMTALAALCFVMIGVGGGTLDHSWLLGLPRCFLQFIAGACLWRAFDLGIAARRHANAIMLVGLMLLVVVLAAERGQLLAPFAFAAIVLACALESPIATTLFANRTALFLGEISFSIYLSHAIILSGSVLLAQSFALAEAPLVVRAAALALVCAAIAGVSLVSWRIVERPAQAAGRAFQLRLARRRLSSRQDG